MGADDYHPLVRQAIADGWEPASIARLVILISRTWKWPSDVTAQCILAECPELLQMAAFNEPLADVFTPEEFISMIRQRSSYTPAHIARAYVELRAVIKLKNSKMLSAVAKGWNFEARSHLIIRVIDDCVNSVKGAAKLVARASEAFSWKRKKRTRLMQAIIDHSVFEGLFGSPQAVFKVMPDLEGRVHLQEGMGEGSSDEGDSEDAAFIHDGPLEYYNSSDAEDGPSSAEDEPKDTSATTATTPRGRKKHRGVIESDSDGSPPRGDADIDDIGVATRRTKKQRRSSAIQAGQREEAQCKRMDGKRRLKRLKRGSKRA